MKKNKNHEEVMTILQKHQRTIEENLFLIDNNAYSKKQLALMWNTLNSWGWDYSLGDRPKGWNEMPNYDKENNENKNTKYYNIIQYIKCIEKKIGMKEVLKFHHIYNLGRNIFQFYWWWYTTGSKSIFRL